MVAEGVGGGVDGDVSGRWGWVGRLLGQCLLGGPGWGEELQVFGQGPEGVVAGGVGPVEKVVQPAAGVGALGGGLELLGENGRHWLVDGVGDGEEDVVERDLALRKSAVL